MIAPPETRYARNGTVHLAYQVLGEGPVNLVGVGSGPSSHIDFMWMEPSAARWLRRLASFSRLVAYDNRGVGRLDSRGMHQLKGVPGSWEVFSVVS